MRWTLSLCVKNFTKHFTSTVSKNFTFLLLFDNEVYKKKKMQRNITNIKPIKICLLALSPSSLAERNTVDYHLLTKIYRNESKICLYVKSKLSIEKEMKNDDYNIFRFQASKEKYDNYNNNIGLCIENMVFFYLWICSINVWV